MADIPQFSEDIVAFVSDPENAAILKSVLTEKLDSYAAETFSKMDYSVRDAICSKYGFDDRESTVAHLQHATRELESTQRSYQMVWGTLVLLLMVLLLCIPPQGQLEYFMLLAVSSVLLAVGVMLPMIDIDARISSLSFQLLGENIVFENQVVFRKSKSILEVIELMLTNGTIQTRFVGFLVLLFSLLLPFAKLFCSLVYLRSDKVRQNRLVRTIVFRSGKWSMADVLVVAIFMSFIGFSSIVTEQMQQLRSLTPALEMLTTNNSSLLFGFYSFVSFVLLSMLVSMRLSEVPLSTDK